MHSKTLALAIAAALGFAGYGARADAATRPQSTASAAEVAQLKAQLAALQAKVDELSQQSEAQTAAQAETAQAVQKVEADGKNAGGTQSKSLEALNKLVNNTKVSGKMFFDFTNIDQKNSDTGRTAANGTGLDVKRFYLGVDHKFNDIWSANLTTDFNYVANDGETNLFVKKAYVQGKFDQAAILRIGSADMPWIPFVENVYGYRYVENTITDRLKYANSADWGLHALGDVGAGKMFNYAVSVVNGAGYKNPSRSKGVDVEARVGFVPFDGLTVALGGYSGHRGQETQTTSAPHTAQRGDFLIAYVNKQFRVGGEYFTAKDWNNVLTPRSDKADGWSVWGSVALNDDLSLFARYDEAKLSKDLDRNAKDTYWNLGLQYQVTKGFKLAGVWKHEKGDKSVTTPLPAHVQNVKTNEIGVFGEVAF
ncbi:MAG: carbohydrate porin [Rhodanobacter sp.]|nr:MAG: carbohydrate porin [Rhodanobacter sp.]TAM13780.1 MAG: carbohydrate porin [Rhodanobacter sp.]TAM34496.1 MAG: carbohydrate porin [Rhodanobacter sp.]